MELGTKLDEAENVKESANDLQEALLIAKTEALSGDYRRLISFQKDALALTNRMTDLHLAGYTMAELGPLVVEAFNIDPAKTWENHFAAQYSGFKAALDALIAFRTSNQSDLYATAQDNDEGYVEYKGSLSVTIRDDFITHIDTITAFELS